MICCMDFRVGDKCSSPYFLFIFEGSIPPSLLQVQKFDSSKEFQSEFVFINLRIVNFDTSLFRSVVRLFSGSFVGSSLQSWFSSDLLRGEHVGIAIWITCKIRQDILTPPFLAISMFFVLVHARLLLWTLVGPTPGRPSWFVQWISFVKEAGRRRRPGYKVQLHRVLHDEWE